ncbi:hypothetical protein M0804_006285 [Polistes exclamans]|nr:hypothetical protein M0804_006285 [Polistes exclamans]
MHQVTTLHHDKLLTISSHSSHTTCLTSTSSVHHHHRPPQPQPPVVQEPKMEQNLGEPEPEEPPSPHGSSSEPRIEDSECYRSQSAIFVRYMNQDENNSCTRTDFMFQPFPTTKLGKKRAKRLRKEAVRKREELDRVAKQQARKKITNKN